MIAVDRKPRKLVRRSSRTLRPTATSLARVLVVDDNVTSRLTLQTVLEAGGYSVDSAASAAEAVGKMDRKEYELILSDLQMESPEAGLTVLAHARLKDYQPATALITAYHGHVKGNGRSVLIEPENVPDVLMHVAGLISQRATKRLERELRLAAAGN